VDWRAVLTLVAESTGDDIFIDEIEARTTPEGGELRLRGTAEAGSDADASDAVAGIVQRFQRSPLVLEVQLGATSRDQRGDDTAVRTFALTLRVRPSTPEHLEILRFAEKLAAAEEEQ
jgi:hypothetical protein